MSESVNIFRPFTHSVIYLSIHLKSGAKVRKNCPTLMPLIFNSNNKTQTSSI